MIACCFLDSILSEGRTIFAKKKVSNRAKELSSEKSHYLSFILFSIFVIFTVQWQIGCSSLSEKEHTWCARDSKSRPHDGRCRWVHRAKGTCPDDFFKKIEYHLGNRLGSPKREREGMCTCGQSYKRSIIVNCCSIYNHRSLSDCRIVNYDRREFR